MDDREAEIELLAEDQKEERERKRRATPGFRERSGEDRRPGDQDALRREDAGLLGDLLGDAEIKPGEAAAFDEMLTVLRRGRLPLTRRQRELAERVARRVGVTVGDPATRNARVKPGEPVEPPPVLSPGSVRAALEARERARQRAAEKRARET